MHSESESTVAPRGDDAPVGAVRVPWQLKIVAFLFIAAGTHAAFSMVAGLFHDALNIRIDVLCLPIGINLLRPKEGAVSCAGSLLLLGLIGAGLGIVIMALVRKDGYIRIGDTTLAPVTWYIILCLLIAAFLLFLWMMRVLDRQEVWRALRLAGKSSRYPHRAAWIVVGGIVAGLAVAAGAEYLRWRANPETGFRSGAHKNGGYMVSYALAFDRLSYAVFQNAPLGETITSAVTGSSREKWLSRFDGTKVRLPGEHRLYEFRDGRLLTSDVRVTREEFEAFLHSHPDEYTIDALLESIGKTPVVTP